MRRWQKILLGIVGLYTAGALVLGLAVGVWIWRAGCLWIALDVPADGLSVRLPVPLAAAEMGLALARHTPNSRRVAQELSEVRHLFPAIADLAGGLAEAPDGVLVKVHGGGDRVRIEKRDGRLWIEVEADGDHVVISAPVRAPERLLAQIANLTT